MDFFQYIIQHITLVGIGVLIAAAAGIMLAILAYLVKILSKPILIITDIIQTIPSLALFAILMIFFGLGNKTLIIGLVLYSLLPITRNTFTGLMQTPQAVKDAARGMGMSSIQRIFKIELPLALPMVIAGIKIAMVTALSIAVMGVLIGAEGLGTPIYRGIQNQNLSMVLRSSLPIIIASVVFDLLLGRLEHMLLKHR